MRSFLSLGILLCTLTFGMAQEYPIDERIAEIESALSEENYLFAEETLTREMDGLKKAKDWMNVSYLIQYAGRVADKTKGEGSGLGIVQAGVEEVINSTKDKLAHRQAHLESHTYYAHIGRHDLAYEANRVALDITLSIPDHSPVQWAMIESNLGVIANYLGKPDLAKSHTLRALEGYERDPETSFENKFNLYNDLGARYFYSTQLDSAEYFWKKSLELLLEMDQSPVNVHYRRAMVESNLGAVYDVRGQVQESIRLVKSSIHHAREFINTAQDDPKRERSFLTLFYGSINLAATYKNIGHYAEALQIHEYTLKQKERHFPAGHPEILESLVLVGQAHYSLQNFGEAKRWLYLGLEGWEKLPGDYFIQKGDAHNTLGRVYSKEGEAELAKKHYKAAGANYQKAFTDSYDNVYLDFLATASAFYAKEKEKDLAISMANQGLDYISRVKGLQSVSGFRQVINRGQVAYYLGEFDEALRFANEAQKITDQLIMRAESSLDSIAITFDQPEAFLLEVKATYAIMEEKSQESLQRLLIRLQEGLEIADRRKQIISEEEDMRVLIAHNDELMALIKKIQLEIYHQTGSMEILEALMAIQEAGVYQKIRSHMIQSMQSGFVDVPDEVLVEEKQRKESIKELLESGGSLSAYYQAQEEWELFLNSLKTMYPNYFKWKYSRIWDQDWALPKQVQWVRYFFVEDDLFAVVNKGQELILFSLDFDQTLIPKLSGNWHDPKLTTDICHQLYHQLWAPFAEQLEETQVYIVPDGVLHNLSFDLLLYEPGETFKDFAHVSLLSKYDLSIHFSLFLLPIEQKLNPKSNYVAFAPGFLDDMKAAYLDNLQDSLSLDNAYMSLLPQPFTLSLAESASKLLSGKSFTLDNSTTRNFKERAGDHKIIHLGTHAESNNLSPGLSRLIFAKTGEEDHSLYAYEVYDVDLSANLTVLTACETGKPVFQPGEGMISLAHAFQYAGSESLLTSLWKIDEKASMEITGYFFENLLEGAPKDRALKEAKISYLTNNDGRVLSPQYWAGLVLIGNPEPIPFHKNINPHWWGLLVIGAAVSVLILKRMQISKINSP